MSDRDKRIQVTVKVFTICWLVWSCLFVTSGIGNLIRLVLMETTGLFQYNPYTAFETIACLIIFPLCGLEFSILSYRLIKKNGIHYKKNTSQAVSSWEKFKVKANQPTFFLLFGIILFGALFAVSILEVCVTDNGMQIMAWGIAMIYSLGIGIFTIIPYILIKLNETEEKRSQARLKRETERRQAVCIQLLSSVGMRFFVKYYDYLKSWNASDIIDIVEEDYGEQDKRQRIEAAQIIFQKNLQQTSLMIISVSSKIDEDTKSKAKDLIG